MERELWDLFSFAVEVLDLELGAMWLSTCVCTMRLAV